jgi:hypothetical protein
MEAADKIIQLATHTVQLIILIAPFLIYLWRRGK